MWLVRILGSVTCALIGAQHGRKRSRFRSFKSSLTGSKGSDTRLNDEANSDFFHFFVAFFATIPGISCQNEQKRTRFRARFRAEGKLPGTLEQSEPHCCKHEVHFPVAGILKGSLGT
jgi:hypothetical protein